MIQPLDRLSIRFELNGRKVEREIPVRQLLVDFLRDDLGLIATRVGCEQGACGSCTVMLDGVSVRSCLMFAVQVDGCEVRTVEGLAQGDTMHPLQQAFWDNHALQCGFCTSGFLMTGVDLIEHRAELDEKEIRHALSGNLCRCTGYANIVAAVRSALAGKA
jgi:aerobic-type carbon monoxide dehydrogenase small subunit (CoxS/CutS family)